MLPERLTYKDILFSPVIPAQAWDFLRNRQENEVRGTRKKIYNKILNLTGENSNALLAARRAAAPQGSKRKPRFSRSEPRIPARTAG